MKTTTEMANLIKFCRLCKSINAGQITTKYANFILSRGVSTSQSRHGLMEFFDDKKNWNETEVKQGRSWRKEELRIKSNTDLHKLWYVLLKERNMLYTMEEEYKRECRGLPSPERIDKVLDSMDNLEAVVRERNRAYHELETGEIGEQPVQMIKNKFGLPEEYKLTEHSIPKEINKEWQEEQAIQCDPKDVRNFLMKHREKEAFTKLKAQRRNFNHVIKLLNRFPNMDMEALKEQYPDVDIEKAKNSRKYKPPPVFD